MSPIPAFGHSSYLIIGLKEATFDTFLAPTNGNKIRFSDFSVAPNIGTLKQNVLHGQLSGLELIEGLSYWQGTFTTLMNYDGMLELFRAACGGYTNTSLGGGAARDHVFREATSATAIVTNLNSYSIEVSWGNVPTGKVYRLTGAKILGFTIRATAGNGADGLVQVVFDLWARKLQINAGAGYDPTTTGVTEPTRRRVSFYHPWFFNEGAMGPYADSRIKSFEVTYQPPHETERAYMSSKFPDEPIRSEELVPTWRITQELSGPDHVSVREGFETTPIQLIMQDPNAIVSRLSAGCTPQNGNTITRLVGSFIVDGWQVGDHVDPTADGGVMPGSYVTNVAALTLTVTGTTTLGASTSLTGGLRREFELRSSQTKLTDMSQPISAYGKIIVTSTWTAHYDPTDFASLFVRIRNTAAALA